MKQFEHTVTTPGGIHARTTGRMVSLAAGYTCTVTVLYNGRKADLRRPIELLALAVPQGQTVTVQTEGPDEDVCAAALQQHMQQTV